MSTFKHHRNNKYRYNIYENNIETIEVKSFYLILRNTLFFIALILSLFVTSLVSFDTYKNKRDQRLQTLVINQVQQNQVKDEITQLELTKVISNTIIQKIDADNHITSINQHQLKRIIKNVMEKVKDSPKQIIYTQK